MITINLIGVDTTQPEQRVQVTQALANFVNGHERFKPYRTQTNNNVWALDKDRDWTLEYLPNSKGRINLIYAHQASRNGELALANWLTFAFHCKILEHK